MTTWTRFSELEAVETVEVDEVDDDEELTDELLFGDFDDELPADEALFAEAVDDFDETPVAAPGPTAAVKRAPERQESGPTSFSRTRWLSVIKG